MLAIILQADPSQQSQPTGYERGLVLIAATTLTCSILSGLGFLVYPMGWRIAISTCLPGVIRKKLRGRALLVFREFYEKNKRVKLSPILIFWGKKKTNNNKKTPQWVEVTWQAREAWVLNPKPQVWVQVYALCNHRSRFLHLWNVGPTLHPGNFLGCGET